MGLNEKEHIIEHGIDVTDLMQKFDSDNLMYYSGRTGIMNSDMIDAFANIYKDLIEMQKNYADGIGNRKELAGEILNKANVLSRLMDFLKVDLSRTHDFERYNHQDALWSRDKAMQVLLKLANKENDIYELRCLKPYAYELLSTKYSGLNPQKCCVWILAKKELLDNIDVGELFKIIDANGYKGPVVNTNSSSVVYSDNDDIDDNMTLTGRRIGKRLLFCACDDELGRAINALNDYIKEYGGDLAFLSVDDIVEKMSVSMKK